MSDRGEHDFIRACSQNHQRLACPPLTDIPPFGQGKYESMMTNRTAESTFTSESSPVTVGVDTHADTHHVAVLSTTGARLGDRQVPTHSGRMRTTPRVRSHLRSDPAHRRRGDQLLWSRPGSVPDGQKRREQIDLIRPRRAARRHGKSDPIDAYAAAGQALAEPEALPLAKTGDGVVEQIRVLLTVRRSAIKA